MNYDEAMNYITNKAKFGMNLGLERTKKILEFLGNPQETVKCVHIAGTNGKGSTTMMLTSVLIEAGYKVGMYTSPFLEEFEERIQVDGKNISKDDLAEVVTKVSKVVDKVVDMGYENPTEFEIITCAMFCYFAKCKVDYAVVEVGLGGKLDSTNVIENPLLTVITSISYDHMNILGDKLSDIAGEKAGIIKTGAPVILYPQQEEAERVIKDVADKKGSPFIKVPSNCARFLGIDECKSTYAQKISVKTSQQTYSFSLSLLGMHQLLNCATALYAVEELKKLGADITEEHVKNALSKVKWPGRMEVMNSKPLVVIDGAHNIDGISRLAESVKQYFKYEKMVMILGILADKQVKNMVDVIAPMASHVIVVSPHNYRAEDPEIIMNYVTEHDVECEVMEKYDEAYEKALSICDEGDMLLISGSLYMIGDMRKIIRN